MKNMTAAHGSAFCDILEELSNIFIVEVLIVYATSYIILGFAKMPLIVGFKFCKYPLLWLPPKCLLQHSLSLSQTLISQSLSCNKTEL